MIAPPEKLRLGRPLWTTYYRLGVVYSKQLPTFATLDEVGAHFGISKQNAYTETVLALGKLIYRLNDHVFTNPASAGLRTQHLKAK